MDQKKEKVYEIIELFENLLENYGITIDNDDRLEALKSENNVAAIYGDEYYNLEDQIYKTLYPTNE